MKIGLTRIEWLILLCIAVILFSIGREWYHDSRRIQATGQAEQLTWVRLNEPAVTSNSLYRTSIPEGTLYFSNGGLVFVPGK